MNDSSNDSSTSMTAVTAKISGFTDGFSKFVHDQNIIGLALGIILAQSSIEISKKLGANFVKPIVRFLSGKDDILNINTEEILTDIMILGLTLVIIYFMMTMLGVTPTNEGLALPLTI